MAVIGAVEEYANLSRILWKARQLCHDNYFPCVLTMKISCIGCALESTNGCCTKGEPTSDRIAVKDSICSIPNSKKISLLSSFSQEKKHSHLITRPDKSTIRGYVSLKSLCHLVSSCLSSLSLSQQSLLSLHMSEFCRLKTSRWTPPPPPSHSS